LSDHDSDSRLKLNRNQRETIEQFHARIIGELNALGAVVGEPGAAARPVSTDAPAAPAEPAEGESSG
jgi:hypothetical protein